MEGCKNSKKFNLDKIEKKIIFSLLNIRSICRKSHAVFELISEGIDVFVLTETWHGDSEEISLRLAMPPGYCFVNYIRPHDPYHGGIIIYFRSCFHFQQFGLPHFDTFEAILIQLNIYHRKITLLAIYRPGSSPPTQLFFSEFVSVLEYALNIVSDILIAGDFNIHIERKDDVNALSLLEIFDTFDLSFCPNEPTHILGGTLDLIVFSSNLPFLNCIVHPAGVYSDHSYIMSKFDIKRQPHVRKRRLVRSWKKLDDKLFTSLLCNSLVSQPCEINNVDDALASFENEIKSIVDKVAPLHFVESRQVSLSPWFDGDCRKHKQISRKQERLFRRNPSVENRKAWTMSLIAKSKVFKEKKISYWNALVQSNSDCPKQLWSVFNKIICTNSTSQSEEIISDLTADNFACFFKEKVNKVRESTTGGRYSIFKSTNNFVGKKFSSFVACTEMEVKQIILNSPTKTCLLDSLPTSIFKKFIDIFLPFITSFINLCLGTCTMPSSLKHAIVVPLLKSEKLDKINVGNYRPVSNLKFISKVLERVVSKQLLDHLTSNNLMPIHQSGYRKFHSTETALLQVCSNLFASMDAQNISLLALLDLSAAFDCVDHDLLLKKLSENFGVCDDVASWFRSYLYGRTQQVMVGDSRSQIDSVRFGVPQGSVLGPILFVIYIAEVFRVIEQFGFKAHAYADDLQIMACTPAYDFDSLLNNFVACFSQIDDFMSFHRLKLNQCKTQLIPVGTWQQTSRLRIDSVTLNDCNVPFCQIATNLGFVFDNHLTMNEHVKAITSSCSHQLRKLRMVKCYLNRSALESLVHAFINSRLDYCNSLFYGISVNLMSKLQSIQNQAAKLVDGGLKFNHVSPILKKLHWLPIEKRIVFKIAVLVFRCLKGQAPQYLIDKCVFKTATNLNPRLRSDDMNFLLVPTTHLVIGSRNFDIAGPVIWNGLPKHLRCSELSLLQFRKELKTYLFSL